MKFIISLLIFLATVSNAFASNGGAQLVQFGPYWNTTTNTIYEGIKMMHIATGTSNLLNCWADEAKSVTCKGSGGKTSTDIDEDDGGTCDDTANDGVIGPMYCDGQYDIYVCASTTADASCDNSSIQTIDDYRITSDTATMWEGNWGTSTPEVVAAAKGQQFAVFDGSSNFVSLNINTGTAWISLFSEIDTSGYSDFAAAIAAAGSTPTTFVVSTSENVTGSLTVPSNVTIRMTGQGMLNVSTGVTVTINGSFLADRSKRFTCTGTGKVVFGPEVVDIYAEWWGLVVGNDAANEAANNTALQAALNAAGGDTTGPSRLNTHRLLLPPGVIRYSTGLIAVGNLTGYGTSWTIEGATGVFWEGSVAPDQLVDGGGWTILFYSGTGTAITFRSSGINIGNLLLWGSSLAATGIKMGDASGGGALSAQDYHFYDMAIAGFTAVGAEGLLYDPANNNSETVFDRVSFCLNYDNVVATFTTGFSTVQTYNQCKFQWATRYGFWSDGGTVHTFRFYDPLFQHNGSSAVRVTNGTAGFTFYSPYFESNNTDIAGYTVHFDSGSTTNLHRSTSFFNPTFVSNLDSTTGEFYVANASDFQIFGGHTPNVEKLRIVRAGRTPGFSQVPLSQAKAELGSVISTVSLNCGTNLAALWAFNNKFGDTLASGLLDYGPNALHATLVDGVDTVIDEAFDVTTGGSPYKLFFNGTRYWTIADAAALSSVAGSLSVIALVNFEVNTDQTIVAKWAATTGAEQREYFLYLDASGYPTFEVYDESANSSVGRQDQTALSINTWHTVIATYDQGTPTAAGINIYIDGVAVDDADKTTGATYAAMEDLTGAVGSYYIVPGGTRSGLLNGMMSFLAITKENLTAARAKAIDALLRGYAGTL